MTLLPKFHALSEDIWGAGERPTRRPCCALRRHRSRSHLLAGSGRSLERELSS